VERPADAGTEDACVNWARSSWNGWLRGRRTTRRTSCVRSVAAGRAFKVPATTVRHGLPMDRPRKVQQLEIQECGRWHRGTRPAEGDVVKAACGRRRRLRSHTWTGQRVRVGKTMIADPSRRRTRRQRAHEWRTGAAQTRQPRQGPRWRAHIRVRVIDKLGTPAARPVLSGSVRSCGTTAADERSQARQRALGAPRIKEADRCP